MIAMNADTAAQVQWLVDRARISDVLVEFARTLDERDWSANNALYVPEGVFTAGDTLRLQGHDQLLRTGSPGPGPLPRHVAVPRPTKESSDDRS